MPDVSLPQLLDLSLGNPELGAVNFNQLHKLLLEIIGRLDKAGHPLAVSDVDTKRELKSAAAGNYPKSSYNTLQDKVNKIEKDITNMSTALPDAKDMISKVKTDTPLTDLWQHMQVNKKVENNEQGINTAMGLIQQLIKDMQDLKDENKAMRKKLDQIDMDDINAKLKKLDELRERMKGLTGLADKMNDLDSFKNQLDSLQGFSDKFSTSNDDEPTKEPSHHSVHGLKNTVSSTTRQLVNPLVTCLKDISARLDGLPTGDEIVTWPGLEDALKGVRGEFAAYRPESRTRSAMETRTASATPVPHASAPHASSPQASVPQASVPQAAVTRPSSGRVSHAESTNRPRSGKSALSEVPSVDLVDSLEGLGSINKRHEELKKRVDDLELAMENKANKDDVSGKLPDDLMQRIEDMSNKMTELSDLRTKVNDLDFLLADFPLAVDHKAPIKGDKSRMHSSSTQGSVPRMTESVMSHGPAPPLPPRLYGQSSAQIDMGEGGRRDITTPTKDTQSLRSTGNRRAREDRPYSSHPDQRVSKEGRSRSKKGISKEKSVGYTQDVTAPRSVGYSQDIMAPKSAGYLRSDKGSVRSIPSAPQHVLDSSTVATPQKADHSDEGKLHEVSDLPKAGKGRKMVGPKSAKRTKQGVKGTSSKQEVKGTSGKQSQQLMITPSGQHVDSPHLSSPRLAGEDGNLETGEDITDTLELHFGSESSLSTDSDSYPPGISVQPPSRPTPHESDWRDSSGSQSTHTSQDGKANKLGGTTEDALGLIDDKKQRMVSGKLSDPVKGRVEEAHSELQGPSSSPVISAKDRDKMVIKKLVHPGKGPSKFPKKGMATSDKETDSDNGSFKGLVTNKDSPYYIGEGSPNTAKAPFIQATPSRFARTLREVIHDDYMPEIEDLKRRLAKVETEIPQLRFKAGPPAPIPLPSLPTDQPNMVQYLATDDDDRIADVVRHCNEQFHDVNAHLDDIDDALMEFVNSIGDAESIKRAQKAMTDLQEQLEDFQRILDYLNKENDAKTKEIQKLTSETQKLKDTKADKDYVDAELDAKADKSQVDSKVNRSVFDSTIGDLQKMIDDLLSKLLAYEEAWKKAQGKLEEDIDGKIDRTELDRLKAYLDRKIKELNNKMKQNGGMFNPFCEDAAGLKKQLLPFNCLSCDKPVVVSNNNQMTQSTPGALGDAFTANKSARPYTTFELDQIRQHAKSQTPPGTNAINFAKSMNRQNIAQLKKNNLRAYLVHFGATLGPKVFITRSKQKLLNPEGNDAYSKQRQCGGRHTMRGYACPSSPRGTYDGKTKCLKDLFQDEEFVAAGGLHTSEHFLHGLDGKRYRGRNDNISYDQNLTHAIQDKASDNNEAARAIARNAGSQSEIYRKNTHGGEMSRLNFRNSSAGWNSRQPHTAPIVEVSITNADNLDSIRSNTRASAPAGGAPSSFHDNSRIMLRDDQGESRRGSSAGGTYITINSQDRNINNSAADSESSTHQEQTSLLSECVTVEQLFE